MQRDDNDVVIPPAPPPSPTPPPAPEAPKATFTAAQVQSGVNLFLSVLNGVDSLLPPATKAQIDPYIGLINTVGTQQWFLDLLLVIVNSGQTQQLTAEDVRRAIFEYVRMEAARLA